MNGFGGYPLTLGSVRGYRQWYTDKLGRLYGISHNNIWLPGENEKICNNASASKKGCEIENCTCGFYAYYAPPTPPATNSISGVIEGYGETTVGTDGFRASKGKILALYFPDLDKVAEKEGYAVSTHTGSNGQKYLVAAPGGGTYSTATYTISPVPPLTQTLYTLVKRNYQGVHFYHDWDKLVADFPPSEVVLPSPDNDPTFWTRPISI